MRVQTACCAFEVGYDGQKGFSSGKKTFCGREVNKLNLQKYQKCC